MTSFDRTIAAEPKHSAWVWHGDPRAPDPGAMHLRSCWKKLTAQQKAPTAVYQSPDFFDYLAATEGRDKIDVLTVGPHVGAPAGVVPVQKILFEIPFSVRSRTVLTPRINALRILGSEPMIPKTPEAHDELFSLIAARYRDMAMVEMDAVNIESFLWQYLFSSPVIAENYFVHVLYGVRDCHFVQLPPSIADYHSRLTRKLRHNLQRQERVLERHLNAPLVLTLLNREEHVPAMMAAMKMLNAPGARDPAVARRHLEAARHGFLYCFLLKAGERTVGLSPGTRSNDTYRVQNFFYDRMLAKLSAGTTLWQQVLRFLIEDGGFKSVDMGYGEPVYPHRSINSVCRRGKVLLFRRTLANRILIKAHSGFAAAVNFVKANAEMVDQD